MMRQPPTYVPRPIATPAAIFTQVGIESEAGSPWRCSTSASAITPIVFCASFAPWLNDTHVEDAIWPSRKLRLAGPGCTRANSHSRASRTRNAESPATTGATSAGITTLCAMPCQSTPFVPDWTRAAPTRPPISACDELDGSPSRHVIRFQAIAPTSAAKIVCCVARCASTIPLLTVFATAVVRNAPARFAAAAMRTATRGDMARAPIAVAIEFAVS